MARPRILGGTAAGRAIETPGRGTRPSPSRLREALFDILAFRPVGRFLDLYSGSGAVGLEAASRGWQATCVDTSREAVAVIRRNATRLRLSVDIVRADALAFARSHPACFEVVFAAPPYPLELEPLFQALLTAAPATPGGVYVFQHPSSLAPRLVRGQEAVEPKRYRYGSNGLTLVLV